MGPPRRRLTNAHQLSWFLQFPGTHFSTLLDAGNLEHYSGNSLFIGEVVMPEQVDEDAVRAAAYYLWMADGRPDGKALDHWLRAKTEGGPGDEELLGEQEKVVSGQPADMQAILTNEVRGG